jgi:hypothetical protein
MSESFCSNEKIARAREIHEGFPVCAPGRFAKPINYSGAGDFSQRAAAPEVPRFGRRAVAMRWFQ